MSLHAYQESLEISKDDYDFDSLIMAAFRKADSDNLMHLLSVYPEIWNELQERYNSPGGLIGNEGETQ